MLEKIHELAVQIHDVLPPAASMSTLPSDGDTVESLNLQCPQRDELSKDLIQLDLSAEGQRRLFDIFEHHISGLRLAFEEGYREAVLTLRSRGNDDGAFCLKFRQSLAWKFGGQARDLWSAMVREALRCCASNEDARHQSDNVLTSQAVTSSKVYTHKASRGHDSDAVRVLEQAFQHTPNITQAEKYRLAEVTGLKPKQVTIWVSKALSCTTTLAIIFHRRVCTTNVNDDHNLERESRPIDEGVILLSVARGQ